MAGGGTLRPSAPGTATLTMPMPTDVHAVAADEIEGASWGPA